MATGSLSKIGRLFTMSHLSITNPFFFTKILSATVGTYVPSRKIKGCSSQKPWITTKIKSLIRNRQKALHANGKDSEVYKANRNAVQTICPVAKKSFYTRKIAASGLVSEWRTSLKCVDDLTILELIPRNSISYFPIIASNINKYFLMRNMKLNPK